MTISRILLGAFSAALLLPGIAHAEPVPDVCQSPQLRGRIVEYVIDGQQAAFELAIHPDIMTLLRLPPQVRRVRSPHATDLMITTTPMGVTVQPTKGSSGTFTVYGDISGHELAVTFSIRVFDDPAQAISTAIVRQRTASEPAQSIMRVIAQMQCNQHGPALSQLIPGALDAGDMRTVDESVSQWLFERGDVIRIKDRLPDDQAVGVEVQKYLRMDTRGYLLVSLINREPRPYRLAALQVLNESRERNHVESILLQRLKHHESYTVDDTLIGVIPPRQHLQAVIIMPHANLLGDTVSLMMSEPDGERPMWRNGVQLLDMASSASTNGVRFYTRPDGTEVWDFSTQDENAGVVTLSIKALGGAIWLSDGLGLGELGTTSFQGAGVRVTYGFTKHWNMEIEAAGASSGEACIENVDYKGMQGELVRSATIGRLNMGGLLRFGSGRFLPTVRLGVGLQGSSQSRRLVGSGGETMLDEDGIEVSVSIGGGVGLDIRLVNGFYLGTGISLETGSRDSSAFEAGVNLGYAWRP